MSSLRVLLVDNGSDKSDLISATLAGANLTILPTTGLEEAGEALFVEQFDAVLLASNFPAPSLADFTVKLRQVEKNHLSEIRIPVLALESVSPSGTDGSVHGPLDAAALTAAVKSLAHALAEPTELKARSAIDDLPVLEPEKFEEQVGYDNELMVEIIDLFLAESKKGVADMQTYLDRSDWDALSKGAHTIKGSLGSLHAARGQARAQELESAAGGDLGAQSRHAFHQLVKDLEALEPRLLELKYAITSARA